MLEFFRTHRKSVMVFVVIFVGLPMAVFFGIPNPLNGPGGQNLNQTVIEVSGVPVDAQTFLNNYGRVLDRLRAQGQEIPSTEQLVANGTVDDMIRGLVNDALLTSETEERPYRPEREVLVEQLKEYSIFRDSQGNFNSGYYNQWVTAQKNTGMDWDDIYDMVAAQTRREVYLELLTASGRVLESEVREQYEGLNTKISVRYAKIEPPIEIEESTLAEYFEGQKDNYQTEPQREAIAVAFPLKEEAPPIVAEIIQKARAGEDFAELATAHSVATSRRDGGATGWIAESDALPEFRKALFALNAGDVGEPVEGPLGLYIYKVEEVRTNEDTGAREVSGREIVVATRISPESRKAQEDAAEALRAAAESDGLEAAAKNAGLDIIAVGPFSETDIALKGLSAMDSGPVKAQLQTLPPEGLTNVIPARENVYVAQLTAIHPARPQTFEEAREAVERDWIGNYKLTLEYSEELNNYATMIAKDVDTLDKLPTLFPELGVEVKTSKTFGITDFLFDEGWMMDPRTVHAAVEDKAAGQVVGPVRDFQNQYYFVELVEREGPTEEMWAEDWPEESKRIREFGYLSMTDERVTDYLQHRLEEETANAQVYLDSEAMFALLGIDLNPQELSQEEAAPEIPSE